MSFVQNNTNTSGVTVGTLAGGASTNTINISGTSKFTLSSITGVTSNILTINNTSTDTVDTVAATLGGTAFTDNSLSTLFLSGSGTTTLSRWVDTYNSTLLVLDSATATQTIGASTISPTSAVTSGATVIGETATTGLTVGMPVSGTGIPSGTTIASISSGVSFTLSNATTAALTTSSSLTLGGYSTNTTTGTYFLNATAETLVTSGGKALKFYEVAPLVTTVTGSGAGAITLGLDDTLAGAVTVDFSASNAGNTIYLNRETVGNQADVVKVGNGNNTIYIETSATNAKGSLTLGSGANNVYLPAAHAGSVYAITLATATGTASTYTYSIINNYKDSTDTIAFPDTAGATVTVNTTAVSSVSAGLTLALANTTQHNFYFFTDGTNEYVFQHGGASSTALTTSDSLIEIVGMTNPVTHIATGGIVTA